MYLLEKLAEMFLNIFHRKKMFKNGGVKSYGEKIVLKTLHLDFYFIINIFY